MPSKPSLRTNTVWLVASNIVQRAIEFIIGIILARILAISDFGLLVTIQVFTGAAGFIAGGGMGQALIQSKDIEPRYFHVVFSLQLSICCFIYSIFFITAPWIAGWYETPQYEDLMRVSALSFIIRPFAGCSRAKLHREMRFKLVALINIFSLLITGGTTITFAIHGFGVWSFIYSGLIGSLFSAVLLIFYSRYYPRITYDKIIAKRLGGYGIKFSINDIIEYLRNQTPNFLMGKFLGPSALGLFNKGDSLSAYPVALIAHSAYQTVFRTLSATQENIDQSKYIYLRTVTLATVYTFPFYIGLFWLAEPLITIIYGEKWQLAAAPLQFFCISRLFSCFGNAGGAVLAANNQLGTEIKIQLITWLLAIAGCWYGLQHKDIDVIALGLIPSNIFLNCSISYFALRTVKARLVDLWGALKPAILMNVSLAAILGVSDYLLTSLQNGSLVTTLKLNDYELTLKAIILSPEIYLIILSTIGGIFYATVFLFWPIQSLANEALRWRKILKFSSLLKASTQKS